MSTRRSLILDSVEDLRDPAVERVGEQLAGVPSVGASTGGNFPWRPAITIGFACRFGGSAYQNWQVLKLSRAD